MNGKSISDSLPAWQLESLEQYQLDSSYLQHAQLWFDPLAVSLCSHHAGASCPLLVAVALTPDDFYLSRERRVVS